MNDEEITALAREYAEERASLRQGFLTTKIQAELVIRFLLRRYCLVEKSKLGEAYYLIKNKYDNSESTTDMDLALAQKEILDFIFPEIAKEVEE